MAKNKTLELSIKIAGRVDKSLTAAINHTNTMLGSLSTTMSRVGTAGLASMGALTAATVAGLAKCTKAASEFEASMGDVVKYVDGLADATGKISNKLADNGSTFAENYGAMKEAILDLSTQIPYTAGELTQLAAAAGQSGKAMEDLVQRDAGGNISGFLKDVAMVGTAMDISAEQAGDWAAKWEKAFNMDHSQIMVLFDQINYLGANSATTAALADAMLATGVASDRVGTSIKRTFTNLSKGSSATKAMQEQWAELGFTAEGVARSMQTDSVGTLLSVFQAINNLPSERRVAALSTLFGQWAIEGNAKVVNNLNAFTDALSMVNDPNLYNGSMEREFIIKASTDKSIDQMVESAKYALKVDIGDSFLPVKKQFGLMMIDTINGIRKNMPELEAVGESLATVLANGVSTLGSALQSALPYIQKGLDYVANNGPAVAETLGKIAAVFVGMKFAPGVENLLSGAGSLLLGAASGEGKRKGGLVNGIAGLFYGGQRTGALTANVLSEVGKNGILTSLAATKNTFFNTKGKGIANGANSLLQYFGNVKSSAGAFGKSLGLDKAGSFLGGAFTDIFTTLGSSIASTPQAQALMGAGGFLKNGAMGLLGKAGGIVSAVAGSGFGQAAGKAGGFLGSILGSGAGLLGSVWGPMASGFGSLFAGAAPVIGVISGIIAVVSILGDHLEDIRGIIGSVFGDTGLAVFDTFTGKLGEVGSFISGLFVEGGVAQALSGVQETITTMFGPEAGAAFSGLTTILQSVMTVVGQVVNFATGTVKPIITGLFEYLTGTVVPIILQTFTAAAPSIAGIISGIGSAVMTGMQIIGSAIQVAMPIIQGIITAILTIGSVVVPALLAGIEVFGQGIAGVMEAIQTIFGGVISFITGVFAGDWQKAWQGVQDIFGGIFNGLIELVKAPFNAIIALINKAISGINGLGLDIPDWVPLLGGKKFAINIPQIDMLARGGFTNGPSIAGEAGREAVISFQSGVRAQNISTWMQAGRLLGVSMEQAARAADLRTIDTLNTGNSVELKDIGPGEDDGPDDRNLTYAPHIIIQGNADREVIDEALREAEERFEEWYERMKRRRRRTAY